MENHTHRGEIFTKAGTTASECTEMPFDEFWTHCVVVPENE